MTSNRDHISRGALAGGLGTALMSLVIAGGMAGQLLGQPPPVQITARVEEEVGIRPYLKEPVFQASWLAAHFGYGAIAGIVYSLVRPHLPSSPFLAGLIYGAIVWALSYLGLMPSLGLYPWPKEESRSRMAVMIVAHVVFGVTTAASESRLRMPDHAPARS